MGFTLAPEEIGAILLRHPLDYFSFHPSPWLSAQAQPVFSAGDVTERCSSSTTSANPRVKNTSLQPHKHPLLFTDRGNFWLCPLSAGSFPLALWHSPGWMLDADAESGEQSCPPGVVSASPSPQLAHTASVLLALGVCQLERLKQASCTLGFSLLSLFTSSLESLLPFTFL